MDQLFQSYRDDERRIGEEYLSSLQDLNCNSKPLINMLTMLAEENINYAHVIVRVVEYYISQVPPEFKLPILYLIDSIIKNVKSSYVQLFAQCIVNIFLNAFESVQHSQSQLLEKVRERMYALRQTWNEVFPPSKMYALDVKVKRLDNNWPITAKNPTNKIHVNPAIHVNPDFLKPGMVPGMPAATVATLSSDMEEILQAKTRELLELKKRKLELELEQTKKHLEEQERQLNQATDAIAVAPVVAMPAPPAAVAAHRPPIMDPTIRNSRTPGIPAIPNTPAAQQPFASKPRVNPVNPALLNSVRHRDPRLARQMQSQSSHQEVASSRSSDPRLEGKSSSSQKSSRSRSKSPSRNSNSRSTKSNNGNSSHPNSSSNRKRSESKSSTSSSGSDIRHKSGGGGVSSSTLSPGKRSSKQPSKEHSERYDRNGSPSNSKRKSTSPTSSPSKSKRNASHKSSSSMRGKLSSARSRSRSPIFMDVDLRSGGRKSPEQKSTTPAAASQVASAPPSSSTALAPAAVAVAAKVTVTTNDLEKPNLSTALLLSPSTSASTSAAASAPLVNQGNVSEALQQSISKLLQVQGATGEKRPADSMPPEIDEEGQPPQQKRSKSTKLDALFGSEDVDLRREIPAVVKPGSVNAVIVVEDDSMDNCDVEKPTFSELRAKLAKSARHQKPSGKADKARDQSVVQRIKQLAELKANDDSQEAHDEKMRTILSQAHEMFENHNMNENQYKDLVQKVVAINENSKLNSKESRRRPDGAEVERNAARDAVLRKRIPKLKSNENHATGSPRSDGSPRYEDQATHGSTSPGKPPQNKREKSKRENKRRKPSKWGEQVDPAAAQRAAWQLANVNNNNNNNNNKRAGGSVPVVPAGFRGMPWQQPPAIVMPQTVVPPPPQPPSMLGLPPVPPVTMTKAINSLDNPMADVVRSITIDGGSKEIRFYNQVAIIFMDGDEPHEIGFQHGQRVILIDHNDPLPLSFNDDYKPIQLDGALHRIRFGFPSRELYIDDHWYEIYFGGPPVSLPIGNNLHVLKAEGPPPNVDIGRVRRDLVVGKINMIVDAHTIVPLFLDARQQTFQLGAEQHSIQFVDSFQYALLDGQLQKIEYGGLPKGMKLNGGRSCFIRFGTLPKGVVAGKTHVADMVYIKTEAPAEPPQPPPMIVQPLPVLEQPKAAAPAVSLPAASAALGNLNINDLFQKLVSSGIIGGAATSSIPAISGADSASTKEAPAASAPVEAQKTAAAPVYTSPPTEPIKRINLQRPDTIKTRQSAVVATLYLGMQCSSCGVRFPPEQTIKYSQHLDWHFRQNRRERDSTRKAISRRWYYDLNDWRQYEEIEDAEEREKNFLETQGQSGGPDAIDDLSQQRSLDSPVPTCAAGNDDVDRSCDMCHEKFEQFYNEELEEWHLRSAIRVEDKIYHPLCYEDYKASLNPPAPAKAEQTDANDVDMNNTDDNAMDTILKLEDEDKADDTGKPSQNMFDDDDDDVIVLPNEEPSVTEIVDDDEDEYVPANVTRAEMGVEAEDKDKMDQSSGCEEDGEKQKSSQQPQNESANESDVEIQEPNIPFTDLDTYVEKEMDEETRLALLNVKIKEEPKDEYEEDEDDGFEDVGTVVPLLPLPEDEISINSSETQTQTIGSSPSPATVERPASVASLSLPANDDELEAADTVATVASAETELNGEPQESMHNLSAAGPAPALPLASLVNRIKINITKNSSSNSHNSASNASSTPAATAATMGSGADTQVSAISVIGGSGNCSSAETSQQVNAIQTISTIPVLCGGNTFVPKIATSAPANISSISVIGSSYGNSSSSSNSRSTNTIATTMAPSTATVSAGVVVVAQKPATPPPAVDADPEPVVELKPALRNVTLKRTKKVQNGTETSGLCSIM
ncbi:uncharacterized protein LOC117578746 isoform X3 [Drosophila guanche]|uniref:Pre-mRNA cleavage complex 2 protein Pcf11 n=1 Tax=Drosophila guanche TaxID=7266 RepID=A0A3B0J211_DROGU|nr:uncharacterized protein LOC117578746 isoform X3 [Drosophila guanche]SPP75107.1 blast:Pre-mRNA cleavage complex 2 protein Pcf11 [Drosophila guanche]